MATQKRPLPGSEFARAEANRTVLGFSGARVVSGVNLTIPDDADTTLSFNTDVYDTDGYHVLSPNSRLVVSITGYYDIAANIVWEPSNSGERRVNILHSVDGLIASVEVPAAPGIAENTAEYIGVKYYLKAGEYIYVQVYQNSSGNLDVLSLGYAPSFSISLMGV